MLSRVADNLYWMSRYLERAEHTARLLDVNLHDVLDQTPQSGGRRRERLLVSLNA
ncbi:MAG: alpha-E domain-containing protein, partial [Chloroflexi bacterium]|nr:alpha-E domain-containing protein [Chloroflexota bacterium]